MKRPSSTHRCCALYKLTPRMIINAPTNPATVYQYRRPRSIFTPENILDPISILADRRAASAAFPRGR